jgi:hypothetical protein
VLPRVSSLDLSFNSFAGDDNLRRNKTVAFAHMLQNLEEIDLSHTTDMPLDIVYCPNLRRVIWNSSQQHVELGGEFLPRALTEVCLDSSQLFTPFVLAQKPFFCCRGLLLCFKIVLALNV